MLSGLSVLRNFVLMLAAGFFLIDKKGIVGLALVYVISEGVCLLLVFAIQIFGKNKRLHKRKIQFYQPGF